MVARSVVPSGSYIFAEFQSAILTSPSGRRIGISTDCHRSVMVRWIFSIDSSRLSSGNRMARFLPITSSAVCPERCSNAVLNRVILNIGSQTMIGAFA